MIKCNSFVMRQTETSKFSHFAGTSEFSHFADTWEELEALTEEHFDIAKQGYKDGVMLVPVPADRFFSGVVKVTPETQLSAKLTQRREGEESFVEVTAVGAQKLPAAFVEIVLYRHDVLGEEATTDAEWEIISINARPTVGEEPLTPQTMMRNFLELKGGTKAEYTAQQFAESIWYWSTRAMVG